MPRKKALGGGGTEVTLHEAEIQRFFDRHFGSEMRAIVREGTAMSKARCPRGLTGDLNRSIKGGVDRYGAPDGGYHGYWGTDAEHAMWVHDGTGIYGPNRRPIRPTHGKYLIFTPYRIIGVRTSKLGTGTSGIRIPKKQRRKIAVTSVRGQPKTPFLTGPFEEVLAAHGLRARFTIELAVRRLPGGLR